MRNDQPLLVTGHGSRVLDPPDRSSPRLDLPLACAPVARRLVFSVSRRVARAPAIVRQGLHPERAPAPVHRSGIVQRPGTHLAVFVPIELGSVLLGAALVEGDAVIEIRGVL